MDFLIADASNLIHRAYFARLGPAKIPPPPEETVTTVIRMIDGQCRDGGYNRSECIVVYDGGGTSGRKDIYPEYKAGRSEKSPELVAALEMAHDSFTRLGMCEITVAGYEADDTMATYAALLQAEGHGTALYTSDRDLFQALSDRCIVLQPTMKGLKTWTVKTFADEMTFPHTALPDFKALCGDKVDNLPGVPGVGEGYAKKLLREYGGLENILAVTDIPSAFRSVITAVQAHAEQVLTNRMLATLVGVPGLTGEAARWA